MLIILDLNCTNLLRLESYVPGGSKGRDVILKNRR